MSRPQNIPTNTPTPLDRQPDPGQWPNDGANNPRTATDRPNADAHRPSSTATDPTGREVTPGRQQGTKARAVWSGVIVAAIVLILLLIFIVQNTGNVTIHFFGFTGQIPIAVALLFAAIAGVLLLAIPGTIRMLQLRKAARAEHPTGL